MVNCRVLNLVGMVEGMGTSIIADMVDATRVDKGKNRICRRVARQVVDGFSFLLTDYHV